MRVVTFANPKGGSGKTTSAMLLAEQVAISGGRVAVLDLETTNFCKIMDQELFPIRGAKNIFTIRVGDNYQTGLHRMIFKLVQVQSPDDLDAGQSGPLVILDYKLFGESWDFEVR